MATTQQKKYLNYALSAIRSLGSETGVTLTEIVRFVKTTTDETNRHRLLFNKVREATDRAIKDGLLKRYRRRLTLRNKAAAAGAPCSRAARSDTSSRDQSETEEDTDDEDDEESNAESTDRECSSTEEEESSSDESDKKRDRKKRVTARNGEKKRQAKLRKSVATPKRVGVLRRRDKVAKSKVDKKKGNAKVGKRNVCKLPRRGGGNIARKHLSTRVLSPIGRKSGAVNKATRSRVGRSICRGKKTALVIRKLSIPKVVARGERPTASLVKRLTDLGPHRDCVKGVKPDGRKRKRLCGKSACAATCTSVMDKRDGNYLEDDCAGPDPKIPHLEGNDQDNTVDGMETGRFPMPSGSVKTEEGQGLPGIEEAGGEQRVVVKEEKLEEDEKGDVDKVPEKEKADETVKGEEKDVKKETDDPNYDFYT